MAEEADIRRGVEFAHDLREIRQANGISVEDIHHESKIPVGLIESFEENGLFDHTMFNRVYLRSFVRTYADVIGISSDLALSSLESALDGTYRRALAVEYLGVEPPPEPIASPEDAVIPEPEPGDGATASTAPEQRDLPGSIEAPRPPVTPLRRTPNQAPPEGEGALRASQEEPEEVWTSQSPPPGTRVAPPRPNRTGRQWLYVGISALVVLAVIWAVSNLGDGSAVAPDEAAAPAADTVETVPQQVVAEEIPEPVTLGDTIHVTIVSADSQRVQDIKVTVDDDLRRPYWIEAGQSQTFAALDQIIIEQQLDVVDLLLEGQPYPTDRVDDQGRVVITRESAQQFLADSQ